MVKNFTLITLIAFVSATQSYAWADSVATIEANKNAVLLGKNIIEQTGKYAKPYVGNDLNCTSCHQENGTKPGASPYFGLNSVFPEYNERSGKVISLQERINECFRRSENGKPLSYTSIEMNAIVAYINDISKSVPIGTTPGRGLPAIDVGNRVPDLANGKIVYGAQCASCHGQNGEGIAGTFPPLWGDRSFNDGAGMAKSKKAMQFIHANMPKYAQKKISIQDAQDVAHFIDSQPRPHFNPNAE